MTIFTTNQLLGLCGLILAAVAVHIARDRTHPHRWGSAVFWFVLAVAIGAGQMLPPAAVGYMVLLLAGLTAAGWVAAPKFVHGDAAKLEERARELGNRLVWPVLLVPAVAVAGGFLLHRIHLGEAALASSRQASQVALGFGCILGLIYALRVAREPVGAGVREGGRLLQLLSWTLILPQALAALGGILGQAGVGDVIAQLVAGALPVQHPYVAVVAYCAGMALFTILLGNAFAAFPVMTLGVGLPFIVEAHGGNPAVMGALGMLSGYCGTLVTPMAANFNIVPVRLLELRSDFAVIRAQAPFAAAIWVFNVVVMAACVYRF